MNPDYTLSDRILLWIFKTFPPQEGHIIFKESSNRSISEYDDETRFPFYRYFGRGSELFEGKDVLDLGSGFGGRTIRYLEYGADSVTGVEISEEQVVHAEAFARSKAAEPAKFLVGTGENIPCENESFDLIAMNDVMEHVVSPAEVLQECYRVLRPGGRLAVVFPPYYDVTAGSHLHGYATSFPGLNLIFSTQALKSATAILFDLKGFDYKRFLRDVPTDKLWNLNGLTINGFKQLLRKSSFHVEEMLYLGHLDHRLSAHQGMAALVRRPFFWLAELPAQMPMIQEICCVRVCALCRK